MSDKDRIRSGRAIWAWRLYRMGEFPCNVEVLAVRGTASNNLGAARQSVREMANQDGTPIEWLSHQTVSAAGDDEDEMSALAVRDALDHGMGKNELPPKLQNRD